VKTASENEGEAPTSASDEEDAYIVYKLTIWKVAE